MAAVVRLKRKASDEPAEALLIALKRPKQGCDPSSSELFFRFAGTLKCEAEPINNHIEAAIKKDKLQRAEWGKNPKMSRTKLSVSQRLRAQHKDESHKKRLELFNSRRLILANSASQITEESKENTTLGEAVENELKVIQNMYKLYDIIEETEEVKPKQVESSMDVESAITCNGVPLICENTEPMKTDNSEYVYDVYYIAEGDLDDSFVHSTVCVQKCALNDDLVHYGEDDEPEEYYEDDDDSNEEENWRNDYPEEDSDFEKEFDYYRNYSDDESKMFSRFDDISLGVSSEDEDCSYQSSSAVYGAKYAAYRESVLESLGNLKH